MVVWWPIGEEYAWDPVFSQLLSCDKILSKALLYIFIYKCIVYKVLPKYGVPY